MKRSTCTYLAIPLLSPCLLAPDLVLAQEGSARPALESIVVTAQRTEENLQSTPVSVSALDASAIERLQIDSVEDIGQVMPNVLIRPVTGGSAGITPYIRGGSVTDGANITSEPEVGIYIDGVFQPRAAASFIEALDIERIEVLRGPQGTLYGRNSSAGALKVITRVPGETARMKAEIGVGIWSERHAKLTTSGPIAAEGRLRGGFAGIVRDRDGGRQDNLTQGTDVGAEDYAGFQADLYYQGDVWDGRIKAFYSDYESDGLYASAVDPFALDRPFDEIPFTSGDIEDVLTPLPSYTDTLQYGASLHLTRDLGGTSTLSSITSWAELEDDWSVGFSGGVAAASLGIPGGGFVELFERESLSEQDSLSQEFRIDGTAMEGFLNYQAGLYYFRETGVQSITSAIFFGPAFTEFDVTTDSYAVFGQASFNVTADLSLTVGGRFTRDEKSLDAQVAGQAVSRSDNFEEFTPRAALEYELNEDVFLFASYTEGFKAGGYNGLGATAQALDTPFDTQTVSAWETGFKSEFLDRRVRLNVAAFFNDYEGLQQQSVTSDGVFITENYDAEHMGIEAELSAQLTSALSIWANGVYQDSEYTDVSASGGSAVGALTGNRMITVFDEQLSVGFDYSYPVGPGTLALGANVNHRGDHYSTSDNAEIGHVKDVSLVDAYISYQRDRWKVRLSAKNLTDENYWFTGFGFSLVQARFMADPRTWRASVSYAF